jgi:predicted nucleic acid-binding protein
MIFWDTSALIKAYGSLEKGHARAKNLLLRERGHQGSALLWPEAVSGIVRKLGPDKRGRESLLTLLEEHLRHFCLVPVSEQQIELSARLIRKHGLRAADAIHLAAGMSLARELGRSRIHFATADDEQARAAKAEHLRVIEL